MRLQLIYDFLQVRGGAELFNLDLLWHFPDSQLWVYSADQESFPELADSRIHCLAASLPDNAAIRALAAWHRFAYGRPELSRTDIALFSGHYAPLAASRWPARERILYLHGPALGQRMAPQSEEWSVVPAPLRPLGRWLLDRNANALRQSLSVFDAVWANSRFSANAFESRFGRSAEVAPPRTGPLCAPPTAKGGHYLSFARHESYKRIDRIIEAFRRMPELNLLIAGSGSQTRELRRAAEGASNIRFVATKTREDLRPLVEQCIATIHVSRDEPFGMAAAESLCSGRPVIIAGCGGMAELVESPDHGSRISDDPTTEQIVAAVRQWPADRAYGASAACLARANALRGDDVVSRLELRRRAQSAPR